ncbi:MAG: Crp/Fnr family transcriptional regulator [Hyphomicrobiales bacterium]|nr:Crp/Fnr family transcriptional regulator [Hyphomicrobiales bacterium]
MLKGEAHGEPRTVLPPNGASSLLAGIHLFQGLTNDVLSEIELACRYRRFAASELIDDRDSSGTDVYFLIQGSVRIVNYSLSGREIAYEDLHPGQHFGELAAFDGLPRSACFIAVEPSLIVALPGRAFVDLTRRNPEIARRVILRMTHVIRTANERILDLSTLAAISRVQAELLRQARPSKAAVNAAVIEPVPIHSDIASRVSTTRETVARVLNDLARKGILERTRDRLMIRDLQRLHDMVEEVRG